MNSKIDIDLLKAMMSGDYDPTPENQIFNESISNDLHRNKLVLNDTNATFQDQLNQFEKIIDKSILNNLNQVALIHGNGAGILRKELHKQLRKNKQIKHFELNKNNSGETIVYLK